MASFTRIFAIASGCMALAISGLSQADSLPPGFYINPQVGYYFFDSKRPDGVNVDVEDDVFYGIGLGWQFNSPFALEFNYMTMDTEFEDTPVELDYDQYRLDGLYHFYSGDNYMGGGWLPYLAFGVGQGYFEVPDTDAEDDETQINLGGGIQYLFTDNVGLRTDARAIYGVDNDTVDYAVTLGLAIYFGKQSGEAAVATAATAAAASTISDTDNDGVDDDIDQCRSTPAGAQVDGRGCMMDADGDGVADNMDECANSSRAARVNERGCYAVLTETVEMEVDVQFDLSSTEVAPVYHDEIERMADFMRQYPETDVVIEGYTDSSGPAEFNRNLSQQRADAVADVLVNEFGIASSRVSAIGRGEANPIADNSTPEGRQANRRVVGVLEATVETPAN